MKHLLHIVFEWLHVTFGISVWQFFGGIVLLFLFLGLMDSFHDDETKK